MVIARNGNLVLLIDISYYVYIMIMSVLCSRAQKNMLSIFFPYSTLLLHSSTESEPGFSQVTF